EAFTWYKQSAFRWKGEKLVVYIDPWGLVGDLPPADLILITHAHGDHYEKSDIAKVKASKTAFVAPADVAKELSGKVTAVKPGDRVDVAGVKIEAVPAYNVDPARLQAHPKANNWVGYLMQLGGRTYYHAGDTDRLPELEKIRTDVAFVPIGDGGFVMTVDEAAGLVKAMTATRIQSINPATEEVLASFDAFTPDQVDEAIGQADDAFRAWRARSFSERALPMRKLARIFRERADRYGALMTSEMGKPIT